MGRHPSGFFRAYVASVVTGGLLAHVTSTWWLVTNAPRISVLAWVFVALLVLGELRPMQVLRRGGMSEVTTTWTFAYALLFVTDLPTALAALGVASVAGDLGTRKPWVRVAFNVAQIQLSMLVGGGLLVQFAAVPLDAAPYPDAVVVVLLLAAGSATFLVNNMLLGVVLALSGGVGVRRAFRGDGVTLFFFTDIMLLALSPVFVIVGQRSLALLPLMLVTVLAVYRSARDGLRREHDAMHDSLTRLPNRRMLDDRVSEVLEDAQQDGGSLVVVLLDLDRFKPINDVFGHDVGDLLLQEMARRLLAVERTELVARLGGDEFAVVLEDVDLETSAAIAREVVEALRVPFTGLGFPLEVGCSAGIARFPDHGADVGQLMRAADAAMYGAKRKQAGVAIATSERSQQSRGRISLLTELADAIDDGQLLLHYQPQVDVRTGVVTGMEALVRWEHPQHGMIPPGEFMPMGENTELIGPLTDFVLRRAIVDTRRLLGMGYDLRVAVNLAARSLQDVRLVARVQQALEDSGLVPSRLQLEITESTFMEDVDRASEALTELEAVGVTLSIDDFGTGYSSFERLSTLPLHELKIDRSFVARLCSDPQAAVIADAMVKLGGQLGLHVVAEGVEDVATWEELRRLECGSAQGYLVAAPMPLAALEQWLADRSASIGRPLCEPPGLVVPRDRHLVAIRAPRHGEVAS